MKQTFYSLDSQIFSRHIRIALLSDLHAGIYTKVIDKLKKISPDYILLAGDMLEALDGSCDDTNERSMGVFDACAQIAPTFYTTGNHEDGGTRSQSRKWQGRKKDREYSEKNKKIILNSGVHFLLDSYEIYDGITFGGLASGLITESGKPNLDFLREFAELKAPKILICHHPEYYEPYLKELDIDLIVSGHAHGGQWRIFGRGVYAPGQGLFPKYTSGLHDGKLIISKGLKKGKIPRFFNPREIVIIDI